MNNVSWTWSLYHSTSPFHVALLAAYITIVLVGLTGNALVILIVYNTRSMRTTTNYLLTNLAVADFIALVFCPIPLAVNISGTSFSRQTGDLLCKFLTGNLITEFAVTAAFTCLVFLGTDRYYALMKPLLRTRLRLTKETIGYAIAFNWISPVLYCAPNAIFSAYDETTARCLEPRSIDKAPSMKIYMLVLLVSFIGVCCLLSYCYCEILKGILVTKTVIVTLTPATARADFMARKKLTIVSILVTVNFFISYAPSLTFNVYLAYTHPKHSYETYEKLYMIREVGQLVMCASLSINPFLYSFQSSNYRENMKRLCIRAFRWNNAISPVL